MKHFYKTTQNKVTTITFDREASKANIFDREALEELSHIITEVSKSSVLAIIFQSAKEGIFIAGADIHSLANATTNELGQLIQLGQQVFHQIENLPQRTIAAIDGACVGGGLELALACDYRVASDSKKTKIGLPETQLGILPAWGGSIRLPALIGLNKALPLILKGSLLHAKSALKKGIIHAICPSKNLTTLAHKYIDAPPPRYNHHILYNNSISSFFIERKVKSELYRTTRGNYPALLEATEVACYGVRNSIQDGLAKERSAITKLVQTPQTKELIRLFFQTETAKKHRLSNQKPKRIKNTAVIGSGIMGAGITYWLSNRGLPVIMQDINDTAIAKGMQQIESSYRLAKKRRILNATESQAGLDRITASSRPLNLTHCDLVIEAAVENLPLKKTIFKDLSSRVKEQTILATNTSALPIHELAEVIVNPSRLVGIHFFNPVARMKLVEIVKTEQTSLQTIATTLRFVQSIGKLPIVVKDSPGFVVNRILVPYMLAAGKLFLQGHSAEEIDNAMLEFGMPMGPIRLLDEVGLDVAQHVANTLSHAFPKRMNELPILQQLIEKGMLGKKSKQGFYLYDKKKSTRPNPVAQSMQELSAANRTKHIADHLARLMSLEAKLCLEEGIADSPDVIDFAMVMGTGYAPFRGGPLRYADNASLFESKFYS